MSITLGYTPVPLQVNLTPGASFSAGMTSSAGNWPDGTTITLEFRGSTVTQWPATLTGNTAAWTKTPTDVQTVINADPARVVLRYSDGTNPVEWAIGKVNVIL